ncbi:MAG TPA: NIL domain-containing protein [Candidatus Nitrosotalea sp.]|nr:NIL domain-containing protein [Candidatus Nitrosotalea sp.]
MSRLRLRLVFGADLVREPIIWRLGRDFELVTNIRRAEVTREEGWVMLELQGEDQELERGVAYLGHQGVLVETLEGDIVDK